MAKKWLMLLLEVNEDELPEGNVYTDLPEKLDEAITKVMQPPALDLKTLHLLTLKQKRLIERIADDSAVNYHHHAVSVRGEKCAEEDCEQHPITNVLNLHDHRRGSNTPPGVN
jgi:hypothetical protein